MAVEVVSVAHVCHGYFTVQQEGLTSCFAFFVERDSRLRKQATAGEVKGLSARGVNQRYWELALRWLNALVSCVVGSAAVMELEPSKQQGTSPGNNTWKN